jgi:tRNA pseudouridine55 synthase
VLVVDKPRGPTSHDVVALVRRALRTRSVGHAGTLDPMATGVLVVGVGEATKLCRWLTDDDKSYRATVALGIETDTLDAEGRPVDAQPVPEGLSLSRVVEESMKFLGNAPQRAPAFSAIKVSGKPLYALARRGQSVEPPERVVAVRAIRVHDLLDAEIDLELDVSKGFYVRSFARDLARGLGTRGHLSSLRRLRSGLFGLGDAVSIDVLTRAAAGDEEARCRLGSSLLGLADACRGMPRVVLDEASVRDARQGRIVRWDGVKGDPTLRSEAVEPVALIDERGGLVAIAVSAGDGLRVRRGIQGGQAD